MISAGGAGIGEQEEDGGFLPDLTTLLDILFILLVFFILTAGAVYRSLDLTLPKSVSEQQTRTAEQKHIMLELRADNYAVDGTEFSDLEGLKKALEDTLAQKPEHKLVIAGDKSVSLERLLGVLTYLQSQGIEAANILMQKESTP
ncbi:ExbD/TolR family protein [Sneathiella limimaris]|uniref:ExbD/TolR family protein n=1 Tax=Sneathiella limimaris TaxID=1964213 RepID=UPI00146C7D97|nr:biopolymer transporter ExbD [Sneathiella limimaris]